MRISYHHLLICHDASGLEGGWRFLKVGRLHWEISLSALASGLGAAAGALVRIKGVFECSKQRLFL